MLPSPCGVVQAEDVRMTSHSQGTPTQHLERTHVIAASYCARNLQPNKTRTCWFMRDTCMSHSIIASGNCITRITLYGACYTDPVNRSTAPSYVRNMLGAHPAQWQAYCALNIGIEACLPLQLPFSTNIHSKFCAHEPRMSSL